MIGSLDSISSESVNENNLNVLKSTFSQHKTVTFSLQDVSADYFTILSCYKISEVGSTLRETVATRRDTK